jgi:signal transduction histidine kinase
MPAPTGQVTPFRAFWLEQELFLVREVMAQGKRWVQGVWLDEASLRQSLVTSLTDILPLAQLAPVQSLRFNLQATGLLTANVEPSAQSDPMTLVGLPWRLLPGETARAAVAAASPMRLTLVAAWIAATLAASAASFLLWGVTRLSERRAAFVGSVTHELRTPLTTFRLYSEMLEDGLIQDEGTKKHYLGTLRREAERLTHLVDNVLAYSRIERTRRQTRAERTDLCQWLCRTLPRLEAHAQLAGLQVQLHLSGEPACYSEVDPTGLEQILFNLIDNACKYAAGRCQEPVVHLRLKRSGKWHQIEVEDSGPGIPRSERGRLFSPFHKSADEAASTKPGVGLGLALCKRMAATMRGDLVLLKRDGPGAVFQLKLRVAE